MSTDAPTRPNILMIMVDQLRYPTHGPGGFADPIKDILSFVGDIEKNPYAKHFPGFCKLRKHAVVFTDHTIAESACIPSRASLMTGQYGPRTGVTQTDGLFKSGDARNFPWLRADGTPTLGDWFRELGYTTHYFGKWHVSDPPEHTLQGFGFGDWELSWPEPHGALNNNLGTYRDYQFADLACAFLKNRGLGVPFSRATSEQSAEHPQSPRTPSTAPFLAICSFTNPHDIAVYPTMVRGLGPATWDPETHSWKQQAPFGPGGSVPVPNEGTFSAPPTQGTFRVPMNPTGLPQACATAAPSQDEDLLHNNKPRAQYDYSIKLGLGLAAKTGLAIAQKMGGDPETEIERAVAATLGVAIPFQLQDDPDAAAVGFIQYYAYMIAMVDRHVLRVLDALEQSGLGDDTVVVFVSDHGEYGASHSMMMEKWHGAYQEAVHVPLVFSSKRLNPHIDPVAVSSQTSHIDVLPTLLGIAKATAQELDMARKNLSKTHEAAPLPGADLRHVIHKKGGPVVGPDGKERAGVLFVTDDMITEPLPKDDDPHNVSSWQQYRVYEATVGLLRTPPADGSKRAYLPRLAPGPVIQPNHVRALRSGNWKLVRYCDPWSEAPVADEWELYDLALDPIEVKNLLVYNAEFPTAIPERELLPGLTREKVEETARVLRTELLRQEATLLSPYPSKYPSAGAR